MKKLCLIVVALLMGAVFKTRAQTNAFIVSVKGTITNHSGVKSSVGNIVRDVSSLVTNESDFLVAILDLDNHVLQLVEAVPFVEEDSVATPSSLSQNSNPSMVVRVIGISRSFASTVTGKFDTDLQQLYTDVTFVSLPPMQGDLQADGHYTSKNGIVTGLSAKLVGVWFDPKFSGGEDLNLPEAVFKGSLKSLRSCPVPINYSSIGGRG
ncbi:MAG TPA: hypothetical protein VL171_13715 [Verrucomicrobiae bacterium]|nr:hypothetical protein [Verrucomicrobiae bacterium]